MNPAGRPSVSVIATVRDEGASLDAFLDALAAQTRPIEEVVISDGGSTDGTATVLAARAEGWPALKVVAAPGAGISAGRNRAIEAATGDVIAVTDAGAIADLTWFERLVEPFDDPAVHAVAGSFRPGGTTVFERALGVVITPHGAEVDAARNLPSSRSVAFRREAWAAAGGYPEWLSHCEDLVFDLAVRDAGFAFALRRDAVVTWLPRSTLRAFARQYYLYARGDGRAALWPERHAVRYGSYVAGLGLLGASRRHPMALVVLAAGGGAYLAKFVRRIHRHLGPTPAAAASVALSPLIVVTGDVAKMVGYPVGRWRRHRSGRPETASPAFGPQQGRT